MNFVILNEAMNRSVKCMICGLFGQDRKVNLKSRLWRLFFHVLSYPRAKIRKYVGIKMVARLERSEPICFSSVRGHSVF